MKLLKNALRCCILLFSYGIYSGESVDALPNAIVSVDAASDDLVKKVLTQDPVETPPAFVESTLETKPEQLQEEKTEEKNTLQEWQNHLKTLLVKGAFWDNNTSLPTQTWQDTTYSLAKQALVDDISVANELKNSFLDTINNKLTTIEQSSNLKEFPGLINDFNTKIDDFVKELQQPQEKKIEEQVSTNNLKEQEKVDQKPTITEESKKEDEPQNSVETESSESLETEKSVTKEEKRKEKWQEALENVKSEGISQDEVDNILNEIATIAKKRISTIDQDLQLNEIHNLKAELSDALDSRSASGGPDLHPINSSAAIKNFEKALTTSFQINQNENSVFGQPVGEEQSISYEYPPQQETTYPIVPPSSEEAPKKMSEKTENQKKETAQKELLQKQKNALYEQQMAEQIRIQSAELERVNAERNKQQVLLERSRQQANIEKEKANIEKEKEALLKKNVQLAALQKNAAEKADAQKGILSSIAETVLGEWWKAPTASEKIMKNESIKKDDALKSMIRQLIDPVTEEPFNETTQELIKVAYYKFEEILLAFNSKEFWDSTDIVNQQPNALWIKKIQKPLAILVKYKMITIESAIAIIHETLEAKMIGKTLTHLETTIRSYLQSIELKETQRVHAAQREIEKKKQEKEEERRREIEEQEQALRMQQESIIRQQQEELDKIQQKEKDKMEALKEIKQFNVNWNNLLYTIAHEKSATAVQNDSWTTQALDITKRMLILASSAQIPSIETKNMMTKHTADFAKALLEQQKGNEPGLNIQPIMERFNKQIYE